MAIAYRTLGRICSPALLVLCRAALAALLVAATAASAAMADESSAAGRMLGSLANRSGLCVHLQFSDAAFSGELSAGGAYLVHGLNSDAEAVDRGRKQLAAKGLAGAVTLEQHELERLPHADNLVNLVVAEGSAASLGEESLLSEIARVLRPGGVAYLEAAVGGASGADEQQLQARLAEAKIAAAQRVTLRSRQWLKFRKPRPESMDEWTHRRYDATRNAASADQLAVPSGVRWQAGPNWPTGHRKKSVANRVASRDRLVYVFDDLVETPAGPRRQKTLVARDAYNGLLLWKRTTSNDDSAELVQVDDRIYTVVEDGGPLAALDAATGEVLLSYDDSAGLRQVLHVDGRLLIQLRSGLDCRDAATGKLLWRHEASISDVVAEGNRVYVQGRFRNDEGERINGISAFELASGRRLWHGDSEKWPARTRDGDLLLVHEGVLIFSGGGNHAISADDGSHRWSYEYPTIGHGGSDSKVVCLEGLLWVHNAKSRGPDGKTSYAWEGLDSQTGRLVRRAPHGTFKHRCMADVAAGGLILCGSMDFVDLAAEAHTTFGAARASCGAGGLLPANGLVYTFPHGCGCYSMLRGFLALAADSGLKRLETPAERRLQGPAWPAELTDSPREGDGQWSTFRADASRSGSVRQPPPGELKPLWSRRLGPAGEATLSREWRQADLPPVSSVVIAEGMAYCAVRDTHELLALDAATGETRWTFTSGGRIDSPPTLYRGLCLLSSRDGHVYCLRADDGELVWRLRAAPQERLIVAYGQLESAWPAVGGVLIHDGLAYFAAGRHGAADGGVHVYAADPATGNLVWESNPEGYATGPDVLVADDDHVYMANWRFDARRGVASPSRSDGPLRSIKLGLLNNAWYRQPLALRKNIQQWSAHETEGQMLTFNQHTICGFVAVESVDNSTGAISGRSQLFARPLGDDGRRWENDYPHAAQVKAMALAGDVLLLAGRLDPEEAAADALRTVSLANGRTLSEVKLAEPVAHGGISLGGGRVYLATESGQVICLGEQ